MKRRITAVIFILALLITSACVFAEDVGVPVLLGPRSLFIPASGSCDYHYTAARMTSDDTVTDAPDRRLSAASLPDGVTFEAASGTVTVDSSALPGSQVILLSGDGGSESTHTLFLTDNLLTNGDFTDLPVMTGWDLKNSSALSCRNGIVSFEANTYSTFLLTQAQTIDLSGDTLYEVSFELYTGEATGEPMRARSELIASSAVVYVEAPNADDWTRVSASFRPESDGPYLFSVAVTTEDLLPPVICLRNMTLRQVSKAPSSIAAFPPQAVNCPQTDYITIPYEIFVLDQEGEPIPSPIGFSVSPETPCLIVGDTSLTLIRGLETGVYTVTAYAEDAPDVRTTFAVNVTDTGIDNGSFEAEKSADSWLSAGDAEYMILSDGGNHYAAFTPHADIGALYNNAYVSFRKGESYVFSADLRHRYSDAETFITFIIEDSADPDNLVLAAYFETSTQWTTYKAVFTPEEDISGRFIVAAQIPDGNDEQTVYMDNITAEPADIRADHVRIYGLAARGSQVSGMFDFVNNFDGESASITNWSLASDPAGPYKTLSYSNVADIEITEDMEGRYLRFEVTPISLTAGIVGETVYSTPVYIRPHGQSAIRIKEETDAPPASSPTERRRTLLSDIAPVVLGSATDASFFSDTENHWCKDDITLLSSAGIIAGYEDGSFRPDMPVTRAEFCAFLMRALSLESGIYEGRFSDVSPQSWYAGVIQTMINCSLVRGTGDDTFSPNALITREQIAALLMRVFSLRNVPLTASELRSSDSDAVSPYARTFVSSAASFGILTADGDGFLRPTAPATRAEASAMLARALRILEKNSLTDAPSGAIIDKDQ